MKKLISVLLSTLTAVALVVPCFAAEPTEYPLKREEIRIRDPFVLVHDGKYYMYGTGLKWDGYGCVVSEDLEHWSDPQQVFSAPAGFDGVGDWWAPECHYYNGCFYLFATYRSALSGKRGTAVFKADSPLGPFSLHSDGHITPKYRDCIDGTLYVDEDGQPWIIYVGEWTSNADGVGDMCAAKLNTDLSRIISAPITLFRARDAKWATSHITDGPFVYRTNNGTLLMLWSNHSKTGYSVGIARSLNNTITGKWVQDPKPLYQKNRNNPYDGGHGMVFTDLNGQLRMAIHAPNNAADGRFETAEFIPVSDVGLTLMLNDGPDFWVKSMNRFSYRLKLLSNCYDSLVKFLRTFFSAAGGRSCA